MCSLSYVCVPEAPQSLKELSRLAIRRSIRGRNLARYVPALPLPDALKKYMLFSAERIVDANDVDDDPRYDYEDSDLEEEVADEDGSPAEEDDGMRSENNLWNI